MNEILQKVIPAAHTIKEFEYLLKTKFEFIIPLDVHIAQLPYLRNKAQEHGKRLLLHADMIQGLRSDEAAAQFLCQVIRPAGLISTHSNVISTAKKHKLISIQRIFLIDSHSLNTSYRVMGASNPDYVEILPGILPRIIKEIASQVDKPILAGGFIRTLDDVSRAIDNGVHAVTTSSREIWDSYTA